MSSALQALKIGLSEIEALQRANPSPQAGGGLERPVVTRAIGRAEVVLLCSHLEQYVYGITELAVNALEAAGTPPGDIPDELKLLHCRNPVDDAATTDWISRNDKLGTIALEVAPLWVVGGPPVRLNHERLLAWMRSPDPKSLVRAFRPWGIRDLFAAVTRTAHHRKRFRLKIQELVEKRNNIAHGDFTEEARHLDVASYKRAVRELCERTDRRMARRVEAITSSDDLPW